MDLLNFIVTATGTPFRLKALSTPSAKQRRLLNKPESGDKHFQVINSWEVIKLITMYP